MTEDASGSLVVRGTMNLQLYRAVFGTVLLLQAWLILVTVVGGVMVLSRPDSLTTIVGVVVVFGWSLWLVLDERGVHVRDVPMHFDDVGLAWADCAAVVVSAAPIAAWPVQPVRYVQFMPVREDLVVGSADPGRHWDVRAKILGVSEAVASLSWLELPGSSPDADDVVAWLRTHQPRLRVVGADHSVSDE